MKKPTFERKRNLVYPEEEIGQPEVYNQLIGFDP
jgi:hypothetical protein